MSTTVQITFRCASCGHAQPALVAESANVERSPAWRERVLDGSFMRFACDGCGRPTVVERELLYSDLPRRLFVGVFPRARRSDAVACEALVEAAFRTTFLEDAPAVVRRGAEAIARRAVFGYDELREKVVCADAGLDDRLIEALKIMLMPSLSPAAQAQEPGNGQRAPLRGGLRLDRVDARGILWIDRDLGDGKSELHGVARALYDDLERRRADVAVLLAPLFGGAWVSADRCLPPREAA